MKKTYVFILFTSFVLLSSCSNKVLPVFYKSKNDAKTINDELTNIKLFVSEIGDLRSYESGIVYKGNKKTTGQKDNKYCLNAHGNYSKDFFYYLSKFGARYIYSNSSLRATSIKSVGYDYELKWNISRYEIFQEFSKEAEKAQNKKAYLGAAFGLIGAGIADATTEDYFTSPAKIKIQFENIELHDQEGNIVHEFENLGRVLEDELVADASCDCAYYNVDLQFKYFIKDIIPELERAILDDLVSKKQ